LTTLALLLLLSAIVRIRDLLTGADNRISTSRVNVALWTIAIAFGITTLAALAFGAHQYHMVNPCGLKTTAGGHAPAGAAVDGICVNGKPIAADQLSFDHTFKGGLAPNYLVLLGAPFVTLAGSALIVNRQIDNGSRQKVQSAGLSSYADAFSDDDGSADLAVTDTSSVTVIELRTGEVLSVHDIDPARAYWRNKQRSPGRWPGLPVT